LEAVERSKRFREGWRLEGLERSKWFGVGLEVGSSRFEVRSSRLKEERGLKNGLRYIRG